LQDSGADGAVIDYLQGHVQQGMKGRYGSGKRSLTVLAGEMAKLTYRGLDLSHLETTPTR